MTDSTTKAPMNRDDLLKYLDVARDGCVMTYTAGGGFRTGLVSRDVAERWIHECLEVTLEDDGLPVAIGCRIHCVSAQYDYWLATKRGPGTGSNWPPEHPR